MVALFRRLGKYSGAFVKGEQWASIVAHYIGQGNMSRGGEKICHENDRSAFVGQDGTHLCVGMAVDDENIETQRCAHAMLVFWSFDKFKLAAFFEGQNVFRQEAGAFSGIGFGGPIPMALIGPIIGIFECRFVARAVDVPLDSAPHVVKVKVGEEHVGDVVAIKTVSGQRCIQAVVAVEEVVAEKLFALFVADAGVDED